MPKYELKDPNPRIEDEEVLDHPLEVDGEVFDHDPGNSGGSEFSDNY